MRMKEKKKLANVVRKKRHVDTESRLRKKKSSVWLQHGLDLRAFAAVLHIGNERFMSWMTVVGVSGRIGRERHMRTWG